VSNRATSPRLLLTGGSLGGGPVQSVLVTADGLEAIGPAADRLADQAPTERLDLSGYVLLPAAAEPHAHLDKAMLADRVPNPSGDLAGAIAATRAAYSTMTADDILDRARRALKIAVSRGFTAVRTHVTCEIGLGAEAVNALALLRDEVRATVDVQVIAMAGYPITGREGAVNRGILREALEAGADGVGGAPALDSEPSLAVAELVRFAADGGFMVDLHLDETIDPGSLTVRTFADEVAAHGLGGRATASHCVSLGQQEPAVAREIAMRLAAARITVVTLPQTNLYLQGRATDTRVPRALTAIDILRDAGVVVAGGGDNWRDAFNPASRIDPLETASLLIVAAHMRPGDAYDAVSTSARCAMGLSPDGIVAGSQTDILAVQGSSLNEVIANATEDRVVIRQGRVISRSRVLHEIMPDL
jgi:cytosine deaminase